VRRPEAGLLVLSINVRQRVWTAGGIVTQLVTHPYPACRPPARKARLACRWLSPDVARRLRYVCAIGERAQLWADRPAGPVRWQVVSVVGFQSSPVCVDMFERVFQASVMGVQRPHWWSRYYPECCANGHEWGPGKIIMGWMLCDCPPRLQPRPQDRPGTWLCTVQRPAAGRSGTSHGTSRAKSPKGMCYLTWLAIMDL
jgi:hypothetical protein